MIGHALLPVLGAIVAVVFLPMVMAYCLLRPIGSRYAERDTFNDPKMLAAAEANRRRYTVFGTLKRSARR